MDRVPVDMRVLGRMLPATQLRINVELPLAMPLRRLHDLLLQAVACIGRHVPELRDALPMFNGQYGETLGAVFGRTLRELLPPGSYVTTDSSASQRVLHVGNSVDDLMRSRLIAQALECREHIQIQVWSTLRRPRH